MTLVHHTGSALKDHLLAERARIHAAWRGWRATPCVLPYHKKTLKERIAEAKSMKQRGEISEGRLHTILNAIHGSERDIGECPPKLVSPTIKHIQTVVAHHFNLTMAEMLSRKRTPRIIRPRQIAIYFSRLLILPSLELIGRRFACDHTTVSYSLQKIERLIAKDAVFSKEIETLLKILT